jgi:hypothetical protein
VVGAGAPVVDVNDKRGAHVHGAVNDQVSVNDHINETATFPRLFAAMY